MINELNVREKQAGSRRYCKKRITPWCAPDPYYIILSNLKVKIF